MLWQRTLKIRRKYLMMKVTRFIRIKGDNTSNNQNFLQEYKKKNTRNLKNKAIKTKTITRTIENCQCCYLIGLP